MDLSSIFSGSSPEKMHWGDGLGLWDVARNKTIGLSTLSIFHNQAQDKELKNFIKIGVENIVLPHIEKINKKLSGEGLNVPAEPNLKDKLKANADAAKPNSMIKDDEIAMSLRELVRLTLSLETEALRNATRPDIRNLLKSIYDDDNKLYDDIVKLQKEKNWSDLPPFLH